MAKNPFGHAVAIEYEADKGIGRKIYRHEFGEEGGRRPAVKVNARGKISLPGGDYGILRRDGTDWLVNPPDAAHRRASSMRKSRSAFRHERLASPKKFHRGSFRTVVSGDHRVIVGCPKDHSHRFVRGRCVGGLRTQAVLHPIGERGHSRGRVVVSRSRNPYEIRVAGRRNEYRQTGYEARSRVAALRRSGASPGVRYVTMKELGTPTHNPRKGVNQLAKRKHKTSKRAHRRAKSGHSRKRVYRPVLHRKGRGWQVSRKSPVLHRSRGRVLNPPRRRRSRSSKRRRYSRNPGIAMNPSRRHRSVRRRHYRRNPDFMGLATSLLMGGAIGAVALLATKFLLNVIPFTQGASGMKAAAFLAVGGLAIGAITYVVTKNTALAITAGAVPVAVALYEIAASFLPEKFGGTAMLKAPGAGDDYDLSDVEPGDTVIGDDGQEFVAVDDDNGVGFERNVAGFESHIAGDALIMERSGVGADALIMERA